jgi:EAL domain-containing protein (putative c-di-GMP-specific phosphodiesterase class I)
LGIDVREEESQSIESSSDKLYLCVPQTRLRALMSTAIHAVGLEFDEPFSDVFAIPATSAKLQQLANIWPEAFSHAERMDVRCVRVEGANAVSSADLMRTQTLASLIDEVNGEWLKNVIDARQLATHFQPIVRAAQPDVVYGYECLLRGKDSSDRLISPFQLYSTARKAGHIDGLDAAARLTAIENASREGLNTEVFINFNPRSMDNTFQSLETTLRAVLESPIAAESFVFEIVESDEASDSATLLEIVEHLRTAGCRIALDDVGAGYNSLNLISLLKPDFVKLDMEMIQGVDQDGYKARISGKLLELARELGIQTVAEGVETIGEWQWACEHGADFAQGYLFARPSEKPSESQFSFGIATECESSESMLVTEKNSLNLLAEV